MPQIDSTPALRQPSRRRSRTRSRRTEQASKQPKWNDTPDAIADCRACGPQTQHWRGFPLTTASREAGHSQTTTHATH